MGVLPYPPEVELGSSSVLIVKYWVFTPNISITLLLSVGISGRGLPLHIPPLAVKNFGAHFGLGASSLVFDIAYGVIWPLSCIYDSSVGVSYSHATAVRCGPGLSLLPM